MNKHPMTVRGVEQLRAELENLKRVERPNIIKAIAEARAHGDLKENAEYHAAKERQSFVEGKIQHLENMLAHAQIIDVKKIKNDGKVIFGSTVELTADRGDNTVRYQIVGENEADIKFHKISVTSPIARAIIGKFEGDEVEVKTPQGAVNYEIVTVEYI